MARSEYIVENVEAVLEKKVQKDGKVVGLSSWKNRRVIIVIVKGEREPAGE